ncbi:DUF4183 domain-containing protein [Paenibacillus sp. UNC499MF]|uniref:DUF4183 domain-containing protein n=1 Tax=Paenibacillus sp. UNC499MF TaxID=1502751 RepID=UPI0008A0154A|nr:DUF4183 domain-containing protein [Paenibacillus sp. UNC499MF]SEG55913.1 protein of unknown function [Paenibacillus sp. UNC499MF]
MRLNRKKRKRIRRTSHSGSLRVLQAKTAVFVTFSDGIRRNYGNRDQDPSYGHIRIPDPRTVSYINLFVNAVLQPSGLYRAKQYGGFLGWGNFFKGPPSVIFAAPTSR